MSILSTDELLTRLEARPDNVAAARRFVGAVLDELGCASVSETARLLTSELVTNAVVHARSVLEVRVLLRVDGVRVEVRDESSAGPTRRAVTAADTTGRGMWLLEHLASTWGWSLDVHGGKVVWFELAVPRR